MSGEQMGVLAVFGQWQILVPVSALPEGFIPVRSATYEMVNPGPDGKSLYYRVVPGQYGQPLIDEDPTHHLGPPPKDLVYQNLQGDAVTEPEENIVGLILTDAEGKQVLHRFSMSNAIKQGFAISLTNDGDLTVTHEGATAIYRIVRLIQTNKARIRGLVAVAVLNGEQDWIQVCELQDLALLGLEL